MAASTRAILRYGGREFEIGAADFVVGRTPECHLELDDDRVSRRHAAFRVSSDTLWVRDLESRNGVRVNGKRIDGETALRESDVVTIGDQSIEVASGRAVSGPVTRVAAETVRREIRGGPTVPDAVSWVQADRAFAAGDLRDAETFVADGLSRTYVGVASGKFAPAVLAEATVYALRLASATVNPKWVDWVFRAHEAAQRVLPMPTIEELDRVARALRYRVGSSMKSYVDSLARREEMLSASEKFALRRIQALMRTLLAA